MEPVAVALMATFPLTWAPSKGAARLMASGAVTARAIIATAVLVASATLVAVNITFCAVEIVAGAVYKPLAEMVPTEVRYTGASLAFNMAGIFGASLAPYIATHLAKNYGLAYVGYYLCGAAALTLLALWMMPRPAIATSK